MRDTGSRTEADAGLAARWDEEPYDDRPSLSDLADDSFTRGYRPPATITEKVITELTWSGLTQWPVPARPGASGIAEVAIVGMIEDNLDQIVTTLAGAGYDALPRDGVLYVREKPQEETP